MSDKAPFTSMKQVAIQPPSAVPMYLCDEPAHKRPCYVSYPLSRADEAAARAQKERLEMYCYEDRIVLVLEE